MKKYAKYEKMPDGSRAKQPAVKSMLLQTYFTSLLCLVLCVTMFFGTSYAWFTSGVENEGNEIHIGILDVDLLLGEKSLKDDPNTKVFDDTIRWEPGYTALRTLTVKNKGNLAFNYELMLTSGSAVDEKANDAVLETVAKHFSVYVHKGNYAVDETGPKSFKDITGSDKWAPVMHGDAVATLADILDPAKDIAIAQGDINATTDDGSDTYIIALHMDENAGTDIMGYRVNMNVKLVAYQKGYEQDSFGDEYDDVTFVATAAELQTALDNAKSGEKIFVAPGTYELSEALVLPSNITLYGAQAGNAAKDWANNTTAPKTVIKSTGSNVLEIRQSSDNPAEATANITIDGIMIDCGGKDVTGIYVMKSDGEAIEGIKIINCAVVNSLNDGIDICNTYGAVIENNYVRNVKNTAIHLGNYNGYHYENWTEVTAYVRNNVIEDVFGTVNGAITVENGMGDVVVSDNVIKNVTAGNPVGSSPVKASAILVYDVYQGGEILIDKNTIEGADQGIAIYKYTYNTVMNEDWWEGPKSDNDIVTVSGNKISGFKIFGIATSKLNEKNNTANETLVVIKDNVLSSTDTNNAISSDGTGNVTKNNNTFNGQ